MTTKEHLDTTIKLWHTTIEELNGLGTFLNHEKINDQFYRRILVRGLISVIETFLNITKEIIKIRVVVDPSVRLGWEELAILNERAAKLSDQGKVRVTGEFYKFEPRLKFTLNKFAEVFGAERPNF